MFHGHHEMKNMIAMVKKEFQCQWIQFSSFENICKVRSLGFYFYGYDEWLFPLFYYHNQIRKATKAA